MYYFMFVLGFIFLIWYNYNFHHIYDISRKRALWYSLTFMYGMIGAHIMGRIFTAICSANNISARSNLAIFGAVIFAPPLILLTVYIETVVRRFLNSKKSPPKKKQKKVAKKKTEHISGKNILDMLTPGLFTTIAFGKIGCTIEGCCFGIKCDWGIYSDRIEATVFPVQIFEAITLMLCLLGCYYLKRTRFYRRGMAYPLTATLYCILRFGFEFLRYYEPRLKHLVFGLTLWQSLCIVVIILSLISLFTIYRNEKSSPLPKLTFSHNKKEEKKITSKAGS